LAVVVVDAVFIAVYFVAQLARAASGIKLGFTVVWTLVALAVVFRGLSRIHSARVHRKPS
jgi:hypothetical protein